MLDIHIFTFFCPFREINQLISSPDFLVLPLSTGPRELPMRPYVQAGREKTAWQGCRPWAFGTHFHGICAPRACSGPLSYITLSTHDVVLLCMPNCTQLYGLVGQITELLTLMTCRWVTVTWSNISMTVQGGFWWLFLIFCNTWPTRLLNFKGLSIGPCILSQKSTEIIFFAFYVLISIGYLISTVYNFLYVTESCV